MKSFLLPAVVCAFVLAACSTTPQGPAPGTPRYFQTLEALNVPPATLKRVEAGRVLSYEDILALVKHKVPDTEIVAYLKSTRAPYNNYTKHQLNALLNAGATSTLYNYLGRSEGDFMIDAQNAQQQQNLRNNAKFDKQLWKDPYFIDPDFAGAAPFPYMYPAGWY
ncbi:MAG: hypothetical protein ACREKL_09740 [Chthoniobacterales bacterium]